MGAISASQRPIFAEGDARLCSISYAAQLDSGECLSGTPTVVEQTTSDLTISSKSVSTEDLTINGRSVEAGKAVQFKVSGQKIENSPYTLKITVGTDSYPAQTLVRNVQFVVKES